MKNCKAKCKNDMDKKIEVAKEKIHEVADRLGELIGKAKDKYNNADPTTKKKVMKGIIGAGAVLAGVIGVKKALKKKKKD